LSAVALGGERLGLRELVGSSAHEFEHRGHDFGDVVDTGAARERSDAPRGERHQRLQLLLRGRLGSVEPRHLRTADSRMSVVAALPHLRTADSRMSVVAAPARPRMHYSLSISTPFNEAIVFTNAEVGGYSMSP
jgi:hypothetical protein